MPEVQTWQFLVGIGALMVPIVLAAMARDRSLVAMISTTKDDATKAVKTATDVVHDRINRVRDEYVREDHLNGHLNRIEKRFDELAAETRRRSEATDRRLDEIARLLRVSAAREEGGA